MVDIAILMQELEQIRCSVPYSRADFAKQLGISSITYTRLLKGSLAREKTVRILNKFIREWKNNGNIVYRE